MYGIIDCDNCYVSCERVFRPDLNGKPVVVLSNNDGCIVARSNEAKRLGIKAGLPYFKLQEQYPHQKIAVFSSTKKYPGYRHCCLIDSDEKRIKALKLYRLPMPSSTIFGARTPRLGGVILSG